MESLGAILKTMPKKTLPSITPAVEKLVAASVEIRAYPDIPRWK
jgi:hypothetical protein